MKTEESSSQNWDDLVFENRNREYGAYAIRKSYSTSMSEGLLASIFFGGLIILSAQLPSLFRGAALPLKIETGGITIDPPPIITLLKKVSPQHQARKAITKAIPLITTQPVETIEPKSAESGLSDPTAKGNEDPTGAVENGPTTEVVIVSKPIPILDHAEVMPMYEGGMSAMMKFVQKKLKYPHSAQIIGTEGIVYVQFVVNSDGRVVDVKIVRGISEDCDKEAARVIAMMPGWKAGMQNRMPVSVRMVLPIKFRLEN